MRLGLHRVRPTLLAMAFEEVSVTDVLPVSGVSEVASGDRVPQGDTASERIGAACARLLEVWNFGRYDRVASGGDRSVEVVQPRAGGEWDSDRGAAGEGRGVSGGRAHADARRADGAAAEKPVKTGGLRAETVSGTLPAVECNRTYTQSVVIPL